MFTKIICLAFLTTELISYVEWVCLKTKLVRAETIIGLANTTNIVRGILGVIAIPWALIASFDLSWQWFGGLLCVVGSFVAAYLMDRNSILWLGWRMTACKATFYTLHFGIYLFVWYVAM